MLLVTGDFTVWPLFIAVAWCNPDNEFTHISFKGQYAELRRSSGLRYVSYLSVATAETVRSSRVFSRILK